MRHRWTDRRLRIFALALAMASAVACSESGGVLGALLLALKVFAGLVVAVLIFLPLMAALTTLRAGIRRLLTGRKTDRDPH